MAYTFEQLLAADPSNPSNIAQNGSITIFAPGDETMAPLTITDPDGSPLPNPFTVNANGFGPAFAHATLDRVAWSGGGFTGFVTSYEGMKDEAVAARAAAEAAATNAAAAATADLETRISLGEFEGPAGPLTNLTVGVVEATPGNPLTDEIIAAEVTSGTATTAALNATYGPDAPGLLSRFGLGNVDGAQTAVLFGDSIIAQCQDEAASQTQGNYDAYSWVNWAQMYLGYRLVIVKNAGIGGNTTAQMLARIDTDVKPFASDWVIMDGGVNDVFNGGGTTLATMQANLTAIFDKITKDYGRKVMMMLPTGSGFGTPTTFAVLYQLHRWLKKYAREHRGIYLFDGHGWYSDPDDGMPILGYVRPEDNPTALARGVHPGYLGAAKIGRALADAMQIPLERAGGSYTTTNADTKNLLANGRMVGDQGGGVATSWSFVDNSGVAATGVTTSKVARTDGKPGTIQQVTWNGSGSACKLYQQNTDTTKWATGDLVFAEVEFETEPDTAGGYGSNKALALILSSWNAGTTATVSSVNYRSADGALPAGVDIYPRKGIIRTTALTVPAGTLRLQFSLYLPTGTTRIVSASLRKVDY